MRYLLEADPTSESRRSLFGIPVYVSGQIPVAETVGSSVDCSWIGVVDMAQIVVGRRSDVAISYLSERYASLIRPQSERLRDGTSRQSTKRVSN